MVNFFNKDINKLLVSIIFFLLIIFIINNELVSKIIWWFPELFGDYKLPIKWLECTNLGFNYYENKEEFIGCSKRSFLYGKIFLCFLKLHVCVLTPPLSFPLTPPLSFPLTPPQFLHCSLIRHLIP